MSGLRISHDFPHLTFYQGVLVCWGGASQHPQFWPDLVDSLLLDLERDEEGRGQQDRGEKLRLEAEPREHWLGSV